MLCSYGRDPEPLAGTSQPLGRLGFVSPTVSSKGAGTGCSHLGVSECVTGDLPSGDTCPASQRLGRILSLLHSSQKGAELLGRGVETGVHGTRSPAPPAGPCGLPGHSRRLPLASKLRGSGVLIETVISPCPAALREASMQSGGILRKFRRGGPQGPWRADVQAGPRGHCVEVACSGRGQAPCPLWPCGPWPWHSLWLWPPRLPHPTTLETVWEHPNPSGPLCQQAGPFPRPFPPKTRVAKGEVSLAAECS